MGAWSTPRCGSMRDACGCIASMRTRTSDPPGRGTAGGGIVVQVPDVDERFARIRDAGAEILSEPADQEYGLLEFGVRDPEGPIWWIATPTAAPSLLE